MSDLSYNIDYHIHYRRHQGRSREIFLTLIFSKFKPLKDDALAMSEIKKMGDHRLRFGESMPGRTPKSE